MQLVPPEIERYAEQHSDPPSPLLEELRNRTDDIMPFPGMQVGPVEASFLRMLVRLLNARRVLEIGMFTGYSALMMAEALPDDGELITCDVDPDAEKMARSFFDRSPHGKKIHIRMGRALETIATLQGPFDLVFIDADKESYPAYYDAVFPLVRQGGMIVGDNTLWGGAVLKPREESDRAIIAFNEKVAKDPRVERCLLSVRDGMMLARKL
jgi:caffeoyl-CoA O-methyltransferase